MYIFTLTHGNLGEHISEKELSIQIRRSNLRDMVFELPDQEIIESLSRIGRHKVCALAREGGLSLTTSLCCSV